MIILRLTLDIYLSRLITKLPFFRRCVCFRSRRMYVCIVYVYTCSMRPFSIIVLMQIYGDKRMAFVPFLPLDVIHIKWLEWVIFLYVVLGWLYSYGRIIHIQWYRTLMELLQAFTVHTNISYNMKINWRSVLETKYRLLFCTAIVWADISFFTVWFHFLWEFWLRGRVPIYFLCTFNAFFSIFSYFPFFFRSAWKLKGAISNTRRRILKTLLPFQSCRVVTTLSYIEHIDDNYNQLREPILSLTLWVRKSRYAHTFTMNMQNSLITLFPPFPMAMRKNSIHKPCCMMFT